jgi:hypothetical protein
MSTQEHPHAQAHTPIGDAPPDREDDVWFPPPETSEPTKTESERPPGPASALVETDGHDMPIADAEMATNAPSHNETESATDKP